MNSPREDWHRLGSYVVSARKAAGYKDRRALERATGISERTLGKLENGQRVSADTLAAVAEKVHWTPDSPRLVLAGGEPKDADAVTASVHHIGVPAKPPDPGTNYVRPSYAIPHLEELAQRLERESPGLLHMQVDQLVQTQYLVESLREAQERVQELEAENERLREQIRRSRLKVTG